MNQKRVEGKSYYLLIFPNPVVIRSFVLRTYFIFLKIICFLPLIILRQVINLLTVINLYHSYVKFFHSILQ